jgi:hypothetical protein
MDKIMSDSFHVSFKNLKKRKSYFFTHIEYRFFRPRNTVFLLPKGTTLQHFTNYFIHKIPL